MSPEHKAEIMSPHSVEAEEAVLGSILIDPATLLEVASFLQADDFFIVRNGWVWDAIIRLYERGEAIDYLTVVEELRATDDLQRVGGSAYITHLINQTPTFIYTEAYGRVVERAAVRRRLLHAAGEIASTSRKEDLDAHAVIAEAETILFDATERFVANSSGASIATAASNYFDEVEAARANIGAFGVPSGFNEVDNLLGGFQRDDLIIVAGRPGMGKTSWALSAALNAARTGARVAVFSLEMGNNQLMQRFVAAETGISTERLRLGKLDDSQFALFTESIGRLSELPVHLDDGAELTPMALRTKCRRIQHEQGLDLIIVDYLGLMTGGQRFDSRTLEIAFITRKLKQLARELHVPVIAVSQLNRDVEKRQDKRPQLSDLRQSGSIEQDADVVMFLYRDEVYNPATEQPNQTEVIVAKHRNGPTGTATLFFRKELTQFANLTRTDINLADIYDEEDD